MTRVVVTHTLEAALLRRYDGILVLKNGRIAESGSFDELMEKKGYIRRVSVERDARLKKLELTALGVNMEEGTIRNINQMETLLRQGISDEELEVFFRVIRKMRSNIEIQQEETNRRRE